MKGKDSQDEAGLSSARSSPASPASGGWGRVRCSPRSVTPSSFARGTRRAPSWGSCRAPARHRGQGAPGGDQQARRSLS